MKLSEKEEQELEILRDLRSSKVIPMRQNQRNRMLHLLQKQNIYCCMNPHCEGYEGSDEEVTCPKCGVPLYKPLKANHVEVKFKCYNCRKENEFLSPISDYVANEGLYECLYCKRMNRYFYVHEF